MANKLVVRRQESQSSCNTTQKINAKFIGIDVHSRLHIISCFTQYQQLKKINKLELNGCKELTHTDKQLNLRSFLQDQMYHSDTEYLQFNQELHRYGFSIIAKRLAFQLEEKTS